MHKQRSLVTTLAAGLRTKANDMSLVTDAKGLIGSIREPFAGAWQRNVSIEPAQGLAGYSPVYACVTRIAGDISKLGIRLLAESNELGIFEPAPRTSPFAAVLRKPNDFQNRIQFIRQWLLCKLLFGNAYVLKYRDARSMVNAMYLLDPRGVTPMITPDGGIYYSIASNELARIPTGMRACPASEIIHDRGPTLWHPLVGVPPIIACALSGTLGLRIQQNSAAFFTNMSRPSGMLTAPGTIDDITALRLKADWNENFAGQNIGKLAVLGDGLEYQAMTIAAEQAQLVEQLGLTAIDVATAYAMPAYKINQGAMPSNNNVQALDQQYYSGCLQTYIEDIELCLNEGLDVPPSYSIEFDLDGLLRMDSATQMDVLAKGVGGAILKPDEARRRLNLRGVSGGDQVYLQQQNYSLQALAKRDQQPDPFGKAVAPAPAPAAPAPAPAAAAPAPAPAEASKGIEALLGKAIDGARDAAELVGRAEQRVLEADAARQAAERDAESAKSAAADARARAAEAIERANAAEATAVTPSPAAAPEPADSESLAAALALVQRAADAERLALARVAELQEARAAAEQQLAIAQAQLAAAAGRADADAAAAQQLAAEAEQTADLFDQITKALDAELFA